MPPLVNCYVCSEHFSVVRFEINLRAQITGTKCKRRLKEDASKKLVSFVYRSSSRKVISIILNVVKHSHATYRY